MYRTYGIIGRIFVSFPNLAGGKHTNTLTSAGAGKMADGLADPPESSKFEPLEVEFPSSSTLSTFHDNIETDRDILLGGGEEGSEPGSGLQADVWHEKERFRDAGPCYAGCRWFCSRHCRMCPCYPRSGDVNLFTPRNLAIPVFYTMLGFLLKFPYVALRFYLRDELKATPSQQAIVYSVVMGMPWNFKMLYGFISDTCPIRGRRRKPYMLMGTIACSCSWLLFGVWHSPESPRMGFMCALLFFAVLGMIFADVMADALVVERMKGEKSDRKGGIQSTCWMLRFSGSITGFLLGGWFMDACFAPQSIFFLQGLVPLLTMLPPLYLLEDPVVEGYKRKYKSRSGHSRRHVAGLMSRDRTLRKDRGLSLGSIDGQDDGQVSVTRNLSTRVVEQVSVREAAKAKLLQVWDCVQMNHIWMPMSFIFVFAVTPSNSDAFANFILGPLCFTNAMYTYLLAIGMAASLLGTFIYKRYLRTVPFRRLFCVTLVIAACFSLSQLVLITRLNKTLGIPDFIFALGDEVIVDTASFIVQMPTLVMCASLCPKGVESTLYALMTVVNNIALAVGGSFSASLADAFGISLTNFDNLWALTLFTSLSTLIPVLFIPLVPEGVEACEDSATAIDGAATEDLTYGDNDGGDNDEPSDESSSSQFEGNGKNQQPNIKRNKYGGAGFIAVLVVGLLYSIVNAGIKLSASDAPIMVPSPAPGAYFGQLSPTPSSPSSNRSSLEWQCETEVVDSCGHAVDEEEEDDENAGKGPE